MGTESVGMTDITYPSHPNLPGSEVNTLKPADKLARLSAQPVYSPVLMPNPYQTQRISNPAPQPYVPPQNYPDASVFNMTSAGVNPDMLAPQISAHQNPPQDIAVADEDKPTFERVYEGPQKFLEDVTWSNFKTPTSPTLPVTHTPQPYSAPHQTQHPNPSLGLRAAAGYPPMPQLPVAAQAGAMKLEPVKTGSVKTGSVKDDTQPQNGLKGLAARLAFLSKKPKAEPADDNYAGAQTIKIKDHKFLEHLPQFTTRQSGQSAAPLETIAQNTLVDVPNVTAIKAVRSGRFVFLLGMMSGLVLGFVLLTVLGKIAANKEYATISQAPPQSSSQTSGTSENFKKLNDDIAAISVSEPSVTTTDSTTKQIVVDEDSGSFLDN